MPSQYINPLKIAKNESLSGYLFRSLAWNPVANTKDWGIKSKGSIYLKRIPHKLSLKLFPQHSITSLLQNHTTFKFSKLTEDAEYLAKVLKVWAHHSLVGTGSGNLTTLRYCQECLRE